MEATADTPNLLRLQTAASASATRKEEMELQCPSCNTNLKRCDVAQHCEQEVQRLRQLTVTKTAVTAEATSVGENVSDNEQRKPWTVFQKVQRNRQTRLKQRTRKRPAPPPPEHPCPVCNVNFPQEEIQRHTEQCLRHSNGTNGHAADSSDDEAEEFEEYEWAGQKRIRVSSFLHGGYASIGIGQATTNGVTGLQQAGAAGEEEEEDLNVDEDDTQIYGPTQYHEGDVIPSLLEHDGATGTDGEGDVTNYVRRLITGNHGTTNFQNLNVTDSHEETETPATSTQTTENNTSFTPPPSAHATLTQTYKKNRTTAAPYHQIIESLKEKLRHYENHVQSKFKCLICLDDYRNPAISVSCWHVHCEECWLRSLGARKLCPQCNLITTPKDLRRIYM